MSEQDVELVRAALEASGRGDWNAFSATLDPAVEWIPVRGDPGYQVHRGLPALRLWLGSWLEAFPNMRWEAERIIDAGDSRVLALVRLSGSGGASGAQAETSYATLFTVRSGKIVHVHEYANPGEAFAAAGLPQ